MKTHPFDPSVAAILFAGAIITTAPAADLYWDANGDTTTATGGAGAWSTASTWRDGSATGTLGNWADGNVAVFGGTAGAVTLGSSVSTSQLKVTVTNYTVGATSDVTNTLSFGGTYDDTTRAIDANVNNTTVNSKITGTINGGLVVFHGSNITTPGSSGRLSLGHAGNDFVGDVTVLGGNFAANATVLGAVANKVILKGGALFISSGTGTTTNTFNRAVNVAADSGIGTNIASGGTQTLELSGAITGSNKLTRYAAVNGSTLVKLSGDMTGYSGVFDNQLGDVLVQTTAASVGKWQVTGGTLTFANPTSLYGGNAASWTKENITVNSGASLVLIAGGGGEFTGSDIGTLVGNLTSGIDNNGLKAGSVVRLYVATDNSVTVPGLLADSTGTGGGAVGVAKMGAGTLTLSGANGYTGITNVNAGTLALSGGNDRLASAGTVNFSGAGTLDIGSTTQSLSNLTVDDNVTGTVTGASGNLTVTGSSFALAGATASTTRTLNLSGLGTFGYSNAAGVVTIGYAGTGNTTASQRSLILAGANTFIAASFAIGGNAGGTANPNHTDLVELGQSNTINASIIDIGKNRSSSTMRFRSGLSANPTLTFRATNGTDRANVTVGQSASNPGTNSTLDLVTGVTGASQLDALVGTLTIGIHNRGGSQSTEHTTTGSFTMGGGVLDATNLVLAQVNSGDNRGNVNGTCSTGSGTIKVGTMTLGNDLSSTTPETSITSIFNLSNGGVLFAQTIQPGSNTGTSTRVRTFNWNDGTIKNYDASTDLTIASGLSTFELLGVGTHAFDIGTGRVGTVNQVISGAGALTKLGDGTLALSGANTYSGGSSLNAGTLDITNAGNLGAGAITLASGTTLRVGGGTGTLTLAAGRTLGGSGTIDGRCVVAGTVTPGNSVGTLTVTGLLEFNADAQTVCNVGGTWTTATADKMVTAQGFKLLATPADPWVIHIQPDALTGFTESNKTFVLVEGGAPGTGFDAAAIQIDASAFTTATGAAGIWTIQQNVNNLELVYTAGGASGFTAWASVNAPGETMNDDHDDDGVANGIEYFMGLTGSGMTLLPVPDAGGLVSWPKGAGYTGTYGTDYVIQVSTDLGVVDPWTDVLIGDVIIDGDSVDFDLLPSPQAKRFARLKVTGP